MQDYENTYSQMADEELLSLAEESESLTEAAKNALWVELSRRGLREGAKRAIEHVGKEAEVEIAENLVTIATFDNPPSAELAKMKLESEGIDVFVLYKHMSSAFPPIALGGIKLQVKESDRERAVTTLSREDEGDQG